MSLPGTESERPYVSPDFFVRRDIPRFPEFVFDGIAYSSPSWNDMGDMTFELARQIGETHRSFDIVVALAKGGWTWTRALVDYLNMQRIASLHIQSYRDLGDAGEPRIVEPVNLSVVGQRVLLFDEVIDSGHTAKLGVEYLKQEGAYSVAVAALCYKPGSVVKPDFYTFNTSSWVIFPHERREAIESLYKKWRTTGASDVTIMERFNTLGLPAEQVVFFMQNAGVQ